MADQDEETLTAKQSQLIELLIAGRTQEEAASILEVGARTVARWITLPHVKKAYEELKSNIALQVKERINRLSDKALSALEDSLQCKSSLVKFQASTYVIERVSPADKQIQQTQENENLDPNLIPYMTSEERETVISILKRAEERRIEAEQKITPIRRQA